MEDKASKYKVYYGYAVVALVFFLFGFVTPTFLSNVTSPNQVATGLPNDLDYSSVEDVYDELRKSYDGQLTQDQLLDGLKKGLAQSTGDPYTVYLNKDEAEEFNDELNGTFTGIGAELGIEDGIIVVVAPIDGFPAQEAGLRAKDKIYKIDGEETTNMTIDEAVNRIRGEKGTTVNLTIIRDSEQLEFEITRDTIVVPSVNSEVLEGNIGYIQITRFAEDTTELAQQAAQALKDQGVSKVILDLRNNSGGFLQGAVDVAGLWLDNEVVVEQKRDGKVTESLKSGRNPILGGIDTVVLVNEGSASASEIVAGALQDYGAATLVGVTTYGKGSVQSLEQFRDGAVLKVTIARWFTPHGQNIDETGITPNIEVEYTEADFDAQLDPQKTRAIEELM